MHMLNNDEFMLLILLLISLLSQLIMTPAPLCVDERTIKQ